MRAMYLLEHVKVIARSWFGGEVVNISMTSPNSAVNGEGSESFDRVIKSNECRSFKSDKSRDLCTSA